MRFPDVQFSIVDRLETEMNYEDRDTFGMYKVGTSTGPGPDPRKGPGPELMGADTLVGDKDRLKGAPGFDKANWPNMADQSGAKEIRAFYGTRPYMT